MALRGAEPDEQPRVCRSVGARLLIEQLECLEVPAHRFVRRELRKGPLTGQTCVVDGLRRIGRPRRLGPVVGELAHAPRLIIGRQRFEPLGNAQVGALATRSRQVLIEGVLDERMGEREAPRSSTALLQQRCRDRFIQQVKQTRLGKLEHTEQQIDTALSGLRTAC